MIDGSVIQSGDRFKRAAIGSPQERAEQILWIKNALSVFNYAAIDLMDALTIDADIELNGDETDHSHSEECFIYHYGSGSGCPISDPGGCEHDGREHDWAEPSLAMKVHCDLTAGI